MCTMEAGAEKGGDNRCTPTYPANTAYLLVKKPDDDGEWREHIVIIGKATGAELPPDFIAQVKKLKAPGGGFSAVKGKYGSVSADLVEEFCNAERNVTQDKIKDACNRAAAKKADSGVKELTGHAKYIAELKITHLDLTNTGVTSLLKVPSLTAPCARFTDSIANSSCASRVN